MENWLSISKIIVKFVFYFFIPALTIFFRFRKKIKTGFAVGIILTSFILAIFGTASISEDPFISFEKHINNKNHDEAKRSLKIIIQFGPNYVKKINENKIVYKDLYKKIKKELISEYEEIGQRYLNEYNINDTDCSRLVKNKENLSNLNHGITLINFSESIGGKHAVLKNQLLERVNKGDIIISKLDSQCKGKE